MTKYTLEELIIIVQSINYIKPEISEDKWSFGDILFAAIHDAINNKNQVRAILLLSKKLTPISLVSKRYITEYIQKFCK